MNTTTPNHVSTTERLYEAALELFRTRGFEATAIDDIAQLAQTSRRTFFNHFPTKQHVLARYHAQITRIALQRAADRVPQPGLEQAIEALCLLAMLATEEAELGRALLRLVFADDVVMEQDRADTERFMKWLLRQIELAQAAGDLRADLDRQEAAAMLMGTTSAAMTHWVASRRPAAMPRSFLETRFRLLIEGIGGRS